MLFIQRKPDGECKMTQTSIHFNENVTGNKTLVEIINEIQKSGHRLDEMKIKKTLKSSDGWKRATVGVVYFSKEDSSGVTPKQLPLFP